MVGRWLASSFLQELDGRVVEEDEVCMGKGSDFTKQYAPERTRLNERPAQEGGGEE